MEDAERVRFICSAIPTALDYTGGTLPLETSILHPSASDESSPMKKSA